MNNREHKLYLSYVNREFFRSLLGEKSDFVDGIFPHHMGEFLAFSCPSENDADQLLKIINENYSHLKPMIGNYQIKIVVRKKVATKYKIVYTIPPVKEIKMNMITTATPYTFGNIIDPLREALNVASDEEIYNTPLSAHTISAIAGDVAASRITGTTTTAVTQERPKEVTPPKEKEAKRTPSKILQELGLPFQIGKFKSLVAKVRVPVKPSEKSKATELKGIKSFLQEALAALTPKEEKQIYVLKAIAEESEAGNIYLDALTPCFKDVDTKDEYKESRRAKLIEAAQSLLTEGENE